MRGENRKEGQKGEKCPKEGHNEGEVTVERKDRNKYRRAMEGRTV